MSSYSTDAGARIGVEQCNPDLPSQGPWSGRSAPCAPPAVDDETGGPAVRKTVLDNGISIVTEHVPNSHSVSMGILFDCGPQSESPTQSGLAHFCEHMLFQGTSNRNSTEINRFIDEVGGRVGAFTTRDFTCFVASVLGDYSYHALDLLGDLLLNSTFPEEHIERERQAIVCEIQSENDVPQRRAQDNLKNLVWPDQALGRPIAGDPESVARLTREDAIYFVHRHYTPDRMTIAAVGAVNHDDYVAQARDVFWRLFGEDNPPQYPRVASRPGFSFESSATKQAYFSIGIPSLPYTHESRYALHVLNEIIAGGSSSRLFQKLRDEAGLVYEIGSEYHAYRDAGPIVIEGSTLPENLYRVVGTILDEVHALAVWDKPADEEELNRSKTRIRSSHLMSGEDLETRMGRLASQQLYFGRPLPTDEITSQIDAVDVAALRSLARDGR